MSCPPGSLKDAIAHHMNWVTRQGGLPRYFERIACHLHFEKDRIIQEAIAIAVNAAKRMCATGDLNWPGIQHVNPGSRTEACAAVARWEQMRAAEAAYQASKKST